MIYHNEGKKERGSIRRTGTEGNIRFKNTDGDTRKACLSCCDVVMLYANYLSCCDVHFCCITSATIDPPSGGRERGERFLEIDEEREQEE